MFGSFDSLIPLDPLHSIFLRVVRISLRTTLFYFYNLYGLDTGEVRLLLKKAQSTLLWPEVTIKKNSKKYPEGYLLGKFDFETNQGVMAMVDYIGGSERYLVTIFYKEAKQFLKLLRKNTL